MRPIQLICPLEIRSEVARKPEIATPQVEEKQERPTRRAAEDANEKIRRCLVDED